MHTNLFSQLLPQCTPHSRHQRFGIPSGLTCRTLSGHEPKPRIVGFLQECGGAWNYDNRKLSGETMGKISWDTSVSKSNRLYVAIFWLFFVNLGPVYTTVDKSTGHETMIGRKCNSWPVGVYTRWRRTFWSWASPASRGRTRNSSFGEAQHNKKYFIAFNSSPAHPPFAILDRPEAFSTVV